MLKNLRSNKTAKILLALNLLVIVSYILINFIEPAYILNKIFHQAINNPERVNNIFYRQFLSLIIFAAILFCFSLFYKSVLYSKMLSFLSGASTYITRFFTLNLVLVVSLLYLAILFPLAIAHYDLGYDEAVYLEYAKNFTHTSVAYITLNEKIFLVDTIAMLPYYIASLVNFSLNLTELWHFKAVASFLSAVSLITLFRLSKDLYGNLVSVFFLFFMIIQPGFGFIASSYFGELLQSAFLLYGFSICFRDIKNLESRSKLIASSLFISMAIHTKFQLAFIITFTLIVLYAATRQKGIVKLLGYTILFSALLSALRSLPVLFFDFSLLRRLILITDIFAGPAFASASNILDKFQLFNKFFPIPLFVLISATFYYYARNLFERSIFFFSLITILWWIFLYPLSTYRNPFMGIITLCLMAAILLNKAYVALMLKFTDNSKTVKYVTALSVVFLMVYGYSTNLIYAYIGYNDGVQFDLDGYRNRLFSKSEHDNTQREFYEGVKRLIDQRDTVYNGSWVAQYYLDNPVCTFDKLKESIQNSPGEKYVLVTRDYYPLGFERIYGQIDSLRVNKKLLLKTDKHELYSILK